MNGLNYGLVCRYGPVKSLFKLNLLKLFLTDK